MSQPKPLLSFWQIWNMCFGFLGLQFAFALQNANVSWIFQSLGAGLEQVPLLWIAAPLSGLLVQPLIGYLSDRTWTRLGRRRPYILAGALLATTALFLMPRSPVLWVAAALLWLLDGSINVSMEPFRAFVGDQLSPRQRPTGYAMQSFFIGVGAIVASFLPTCWRTGAWPTQPRRARCRTRCAGRSTPARRCCCCPSAGRCCARVNIRRRRWPRSTMPSRRPP